MKNCKLNRWFYKLALTTLLIFASCSDTFREDFTFRGELSGTVTITPNSEVTVGMELTANYNGWEPVFFQWYRDSSGIGGATGNKYIPTIPGSYSVAASYSTPAFSDWTWSNSVMVNEADFSQRNIEDFGQTAIIHDVFIVRNSSEWNSALNRIRTGAGDRNYVINIIDDFSLNGLSTSQNSFGEANGITVSIRGDHSLSLAGTGRLMVINANQNIIVWDIGLEGQSNNTSNIPLVQVADGEFTLKGKSSIYGNRSSGVSVNNGGTFTMHDTASVYGNNSVGVSVSSGIFTMNNNASVYSNSSNGVSVSSGTFTMNDTASVQGNSSTGVRMSGGTFIMNDSASVYGNTHNGSGSSSGSFPGENPPFPPYNEGRSYNGGGGVVVGSGSTFIMRENTSVNNNSTSGNNYTGGGGVWVDGGEWGVGGIFTMHDNASVHGNTYNGGGSGVGGGGVRVTRGGIFSMNDNASVYGNTSSGSGGGVYLTHDRSIFTMHNSSSVRGNAFSTSGTGTNIGGGGVAIYQGTFRVTGGVVYGSNGGVNSNRVIVTGGSGAALYIGSGTAQYGILSGSGFFTSIGSLSTTENTFNVLNGFLY